MTGRIDTQCLFNNRIKLCFNYLFQPQPQWGIVLVICPKKNVHAHFSYPVPVKNKLSSCNYLASQNLIYSLLLCVQTDIILRAAKPHIAVFITCWSWFHWLQSYSSLTPYLFASNGPLLLCRAQQKNSKYR